MRPHYRRGGAAKGLLGAAGVLAGVAINLLAPSTAFAGGMSLVSSANPSYVGQKVTFTATFPLTCSDGARVVFVVDGRSFGPDAYDNPTGIKVTATLSRVFTSSGAHRVSASFTAGIPPDPVCQDARSLVQHVVVRTSQLPAKLSPVGPSVVAAGAAKATTRSSPVAAPVFSPAPIHPASGSRLIEVGHQVAPATGGSGRTGLALLALLALLASALALSYLRVRRRT